MLFGADYYPEHWPRKRWPEDAKLMRAAGFNLVRMAEFAWVLMEPSEGQFDFSWLDEAISLLGENGIRTILGTPTAAPPAWLCHNYPQVMREDEWRRKVTFGNRQQCCVNVPKFHDATDAIVSAMVEHFGNNENVIGWQIDNEFGRLCYCDDCLGEFHKWLKQKYGSLDKLNDAWGTVFWSQVYTNWHQIPLPWASSNVPNPSLALDYRRFMAESYVKYQQRQIKIIRAGSPGKFITHNFMGFLPEELDYSALAQDLDICSWDNYPSGCSPDRPSAGHATTRGLLNKNFIIMEQESGAGGWGIMGPMPKPGQIRLYSYQAVAHGADGVNYFRWRVCRYGTEQYWHGILDHCGRTNRRYEEVKQTGAELQRIWPEIEGSTVPAETALINDMPSRWSFQVQPGGQGFNWREHAQDYYSALHEANIITDIVPLRADLMKYKLVVAPALFVLSESDAKLLESYVNNGGVLITTFRSAVKDEYGRIHDAPLPAGLEFAGVDVIDYTSPNADEKNLIRSVYKDIPEGPYGVKEWIDVLEPVEDVVVLAEYAGPYACGLPAVTIRKYGKGSVIYVGSWPSRDFIGKLIALASERAGVRPCAKTPANVEAMVRRKGGTDFLFLTNYSAEPCEFPVDREIERVLIGKLESGIAKLESFGVIVAAVKAEG